MSNREDFIECVTRVLEMCGLKGAELTRFAESIANQAEECYGVKP